MANIVEARQLMVNPAEYKKQATRANARLRALRDARLLSKSYAGKEANQYLRKKKRKYFSMNPHAGTMGKKDLRKDNTSNALAILNFLEKKSSKVGELKNIMRDARQNFTDKIIEYSFADDETKQVLKEYLEGLSDAQFKKLMKVYGPIIENSFIRGSGDKFQVIGNHMLSQADKARNQTMAQVINQLAPGIDKAIDTKHAIDNPIRWGKNKLLTNFMNKIDKPEDMDEDTFNNWRNAVYRGAMNGPVEGFRSLLTGYIAPNDNVKQDAYAQVFNLVTGNGKAAAKKLLFDGILLADRKGGFLQSSVLNEMSDKVVNALDYDERTSGRLARNILTDSIKDIIMAGGNLLAAAPAIAKSALFDVAKYALTEAPKQAMKDAKANAEARQEEMKNFKGYTESSFDKDTMAPTTRTVPNRVQFAQDFTNAFLTDPVTAQQIGIKKQAELLGTFAEDRALQVNRKAPVTKISVKDLKKGTGIG